jgi:hypothetical protein
MLGTGLMLGTGSILSNVIKSEFAKRAKPFCVP